MRRGFCREGMTVHLSIGACFLVMYDFRKNWLIGFQCITNDTGKTFESKEAFGMDIPYTWL